MNIRYNAAFEIRCINELRHSIDGFQDILLTIAFYYTIAYIFIHLMNEDAVYKKN